MDDDLLYFNGINGATGDYLLPPMSPEELGRIALGEKWDPALFNELKFRRSQAEEATFALKAGLDPQDLMQAGWGVIFPAAWDPATVAAVREALSELLAQRKAQAGPLYKEFSGGDGYRPGDSKDDFLSRHGAAPGPVEPAAVPYYLLIVGDPQTVPYRFQFELDVAYGAGRIYFATLDEYAQYARSVVTAEKPGAVSLARKAAFFGVANPGDKATALSSEFLVKPLAEKLKSSQPDWDIQLVPPEEALKSRLLDLLGGAETPALLFSASHGMGFPLDDSRQPALQGALLCQDWPGASQKQRGLLRDDYLAGEDISSEASLLGTVCFHFACFGAGTPYWDDFSKQAFSKRTAIAPRAFLAALPQRLLGHPRGGVLAVLGHVDRAWSFSFKWGEAGIQTVSFESTLTRLMSGETVGSAIDDLNLRYAEIATMLSGEIEEAEYTQPDLYKLARLWTANNDARGYALLGDPAVRLPVAPLGTQAAAERPVIAAVTSRSGSLPPPPLGETLPAAPAAVPASVPAAVPSPDSASPPAVPAAEPATEPATAAAPAQPVAAGTPGAAPAYGVGEDYFLGADTLKQVRDSLTDTMQQLAARLAAFVDNATSLNVATYVSDEIESISYNAGTKDFNGEAHQRALTHVSLDGDIKIVIPTEAGELDQALWEIHARMVDQAMSNRTVLIKVAAEILTGFFPKPG